MLVCMKLHQLKNERSTLRYTYIVTLENERSYLGSYQPVDPKDLTTIRTNIKNQIIQEILSLYNITVTLDDFVDF